MGKRKLRRKKNQCKCECVSSVQFSSVQSLDRLGRRGDMRSDSAEILFQSFLLEALVSSPGMGRDVHSLMLSMQHFLCRPRRRPPSKVPRRMILERLSSSVTCPEPCKFPSLDSCQMRCQWTHKEVVLLRIQSLVCAPSRRCRIASSGTWYQKPGSWISESPSRVHVSQP